MPPLELLLLERRHLSPRGLHHELQVLGEGLRCLLRGLARGLLGGALAGRLLLCARLRCDGPRSRGIVECRVAGLDGEGSGRHRASRIEGRSLSGRGRGGLLGGAAGRTLARGLLRPRGLAGRCSRTGTGRLRRGALVASPIRGSPVGAASSAGNRSSLDAIWRPSVTHGRGPHPRGRGFSDQHRGARVVPRAARRVPTARKSMGYTLTARAGSAAPFRCRRRSCRQPVDQPPQRLRSAAGPAPAGSPGVVSAARAPSLLAARSGRRRDVRQVWYAGRPLEVSHTPGCPRARSTPTRVRFGRRTSSVPS